MIRLAISSYTKVKCALTTLLMFGCEIDINAIRKETLMSYNEVYRCLGELIEKGEITITKDRIVEKLSGWNII